MPWFVGRTTLVWWLTAFALAIVLTLTAVRVLRALRELKRIRTRVDAYKQLPLIAEIQRAAAAVARIELALATMSAIVARIGPALATIRRGPLPPDVTAAAMRLWFALRSLRRITR
jgi:hypothetical protein